MASENKEIRKKTRVTIGRRVAVSLITFAILLSSAGILLGYRNYITTMEAQLKEVAAGYARTAGSIIMKGSRDEIPDISDSRYTETLNALKMVRDNNNLLCITAFLIEGEECICLYDVDTEADINLEPGAHFVPKGKDQFKEERNQLDDGEISAIMLNSQSGRRLNLVSGIKDEYGTVLFYVSVSILAENLYRLELNYLIRLSLVLFFVALILTWIAVYLTRKRLVKPISRVAEIASEFVTNNEIREESIQELKEIKTGDEVEDLCQAVVEMRNEILVYGEKIREEAEEKERSKADMNVARRIQAGMLPKDFPDTESVWVNASMTPAKNVGGDFYDFYYLDEDHLVLTVADVSGKGMPASLFMAISKALLKNAVISAKDPAKAFEITNNQLIESNPEEMFVTAWVGILEISTGKLICANAGHEFPALKKAGERFELYKDQHGFVLAGMRDMKYRAYELILEQGDEIFIYSDGVPEATDTDGVLFGTDRMLEALNSKKEAAPEGRLASVQLAINQFVGEASQFDDITMLLLQFRKKQA